jgi:pyruvate dehydrogenase E2 component (dihydrolipoamide acetyltransferase)
VIIRDVEAYTAAVRPAAPAVGKAEDGLVPVSAVRATIARRLSQSMRDSPHFFLRAAVEADRLLAFRALINEGRENKISLNGLFVKLAAAALVRHPRVNASWEGDSIRYRRAVDVALAVALPDGLVAPVVRDCSSKGVERIEEEFRSLIARAKNGGLKPDEIEGAGFTISNLGAWGVEEFTAIINPPGSAILALGAITKEPVVRAGAAGVDEVVIRSMLRATLSCDHRVIDGAVGAAFLKDLKSLIEEPSLALL